MRNKAPVTKHGKTNITITVDVSVRERLAELAKAERRSLTSQILVMLERHPSLAKLEAIDA